MIEHLFLKEVIEHNNIEMLQKAKPEYFLSPPAKHSFIWLREFYENHERIPNLNSVDIITNASFLKDTPSTNLGMYLLTELEERYQRTQYYSAIYDLVEDAENLPLEEIAEKTLDISLSLAEYSTQEDTVSDICDLVEQEVLRKKPLGLGRFDTFNNGMANSEIMLIGGHRGSGKSLLVQNIGLNLYRQLESVVFISLEMRKAEVQARLDAMVSGVSAKALLNGKATKEQQLHVLMKKAQAFKKLNEERNSFIKYVLSEDADLTVAKEKFLKLENNKHRFFIVDLPSGSLNDIIYYITTLKHKYNIKTAIIDYLNIIKSSSDSSEDIYDWKVQINKVTRLKEIARKLDIKLITPMQTGEDGQVRFAKGIEDPVDYSIIFKKKKKDSNILNLETSKIRNGGHIKFDLKLNPESLLIRPLEDTGKE
jgi:replicative DNA helicase